MRKKNAVFAVFAAACIGFASLADAQDGSSCADAIPLSHGSSYVSDTTNTSNWMTSFGPLVSPSNDNLYTFVAGSQPLGTITPIASSYSFAMYLIPSCNESGTEPVPIAATATLGTPISLAMAIEGNRYYLAITGTAAGGPSANGTLNFDTSIPVTLQSFYID